MSFLDRFRACSAPSLDLFRRFVVAGETVGYIGPEFAGQLAAFPLIFSIGRETVELNPDLATFEARTAAVDAVLRELAAKGAVRGWRNEVYRVAATWGAPALLNMERAGVPLFGVQACGVHVNGIVRGEDGLRMWLARRSPTKSLDPNKLDQIIAGGQPAQLSLAENIVKEADEEAGMPAELARRAVPTGAITYTMLRPEGLRRDVVMIYDLELPASFQPMPKDGEVQSFHLWPLEQVRDAARDTEDFKFNCSLVAIHFLVRHGVITPDEPDYLEILAEFRR